MTHLRVIATQLDQITIASPCTVPWESMPGNERVRYCGQCRQQVYNIEELTSGQAMHLIQQWERRVCVRILRRNDGTVVTADCWTRLRAARQRGMLPWLAMLAVVFFVQLWAMRFGLTLLMSLPSYLW